jgi:hypothetical protein
MDEARAEGRSKSSSRRLKRFALALTVIALGWLVIAVVDSIRHHTNWIPYAFAVAFGIASICMRVTGSRQGPTLT